MSYSNNRFLRQLEEPSYESDYEEVPEENIYSSNRFLSQLQDQEEKQEEPKGPTTSIPQAFQVKEISPEDLKNLSVKDRLTYGRELAQQREYLTNKGLGKGFLSGVTLGATEHIPGLKPEEGEFGGTAGEVLGNILPYGAVVKAARYLPNVTKNLPKALQAIEKIVKSGLSGAAVKGTEEAISGEIPGKETLKTGAEFAGIHAALMGLGAGGKYVADFIRNAPESLAKSLEKLLIGGETLPKSIHETDKAKLRELGKLESADIVAQEAANRPSYLPKNIPTGPAAPTITSGQIKPLAGRITPQGKDLGLRPISNKSPQNLEEDVGRIFSPTSFKNTTEGGKSLKNEVMKLDQASYRNVNNLYKKSRELNAAIDEIHPNLANSLLDRLQELQKIPEPSGPQKQLITALENILDDVAEVYGDRIVGFKPINNQILIDQVQSLRQKIDYDFTHGNAKNIFKPTINDLQDAARTAAEHAGNKEALTSFDEARAAYKDWADTFDNDYLRPIRNVQNRDYSKMFKGSLDVDEFNELNKILQKSPEGQQIASALKRDLVNKSLGKYEAKTAQSSIKDFDKDLKELSAVITPEEATEVRNKFLEAKKPSPLTFKAQKTPSKPQEKIVAKYLGKKPEDIAKLMESRSGIQQLRTDLGKSERGKRLFELSKKQRIRSILRENNIEKEFTGEDLYKTLNKQNNFELLSELIGEKETEAARLAAKEIGKKQVGRENIKKFVKKAAVVKFFETIWPLLI